MDLGIPGDLLVQTTAGAALVVVLVALVAGRRTRRRRALTRDVVPAGPHRSTGPGPDGDESGEARVKDAAGLPARIPAPRAPAQSPDPSAADPKPGEIRDRLLSVLLDDPGGAVGAATELEACRRRLDRLSDAIRQESDVLADVLYRLTEAGLRPDQLARLAALPLDEVRDLLEQAVARR